MKIKHHGATTGVTGSCHELALDGDNSVLIDCGLFQGAEISGDGAGFEKLKINFATDHIKALLVTHCHIDHVGRIPYLMAAGFKGPIYCTKPTALMLPQILEDAVKIGFTRDKRLLNRFIKQLQAQIVAVEYKQWLPVQELQAANQQLRVKFQPAGHILGSAYVECEVSHENKKQKQKVIFSGDLGAPYSPLLAAPQSPYSADVVVLESTYGDKQHEGRKLRRQKLKMLIEKSVSDNGVVLIPAFSLGRTQELLYEIEDLINKSTSAKSIWQTLDIVVDSPLASRFTESYRQLKKYWDKEAKQKLVRGRHPLSFKQLTTVDSHSDHKALIKGLSLHPRPAIIIAGSGMCNGGRIVNYLKAFMQNPTTDIIFVGYQAQQTLGRTIQQYGPAGGYVEIDGRRFDIRANVHSLSGYSAHADQKDLVNFIKRMCRKPSEIRLVHGDERAKRILKRELTLICPGSKILIPKK